jgi:hypothetical protein
VGESRRAAEQRKKRSYAERGNENLARIVE